MCEPTNLSVRQWVQSIDPTPKSCSIQKQNSGMINTPLSGGCADEKVIT